MGDRPVAAVYPGNRIVYIVSDYQNKPRRGIDAATDQVVWSWDPDAFGVIQPQAGLTNAVTINLRFPGQYYDIQSGLYYNHNRYYNPELGRYMEADPSGLSAGLNPYAYAGSDPVNAVDPTGLDLMSDMELGNYSINNGFNNRLINMQINSANQWTYNPYPSNSSYPSMQTMSDRDLGDVTGGAKQTDFYAAQSVLMHNYPQIYANSASSFNSALISGMGKTDIFNNVTIDSHLYGDNNTRVDFNIASEFLQTIAHELLHVNQNVLSQFGSSLFGMGVPVAGYWHMKLDQKAESLSNPLLQEFLKKRDDLECNPFFNAGR